MEKNVFTLRLIHERTPLPEAGVKGGFAWRGERPVNHHARPSMTQWADGATVSHANLVEDAARLWGGWGWVGAELPPPWWCSYQLPPLALCSSLLDPPVRLRSFSHSVSPFLSLNSSYGCVACFSWGRKSVLNNMRRPLCF